MNVHLINKKENEELDLEMMVDDFATFFIAGQETTANTLAFVFLELGKNKDIFNKYYSTRFFELVTLN